MKIVFISNILSPHQLHLCDEWVNMGVDLTFIETMNIDKETLPTGWKFTGGRDYLIDYAQFTCRQTEIRSRILDADAVILGSAPKYLLQERLERGKLTFIYSERIYKNLKQVLKWPYHLWKYSRMYGRYENLYLLCASAFSAADYRKVGCFKDKAYKWGYFTEVNDFDIEASLDVSMSGTAHLMWCARFLTWKHPELPVKMACILKDKGYRFTLDMYGSGVELENTKNLAKEFGVEDIVSFKGDTPNKDVLGAMRNHDIFLFTSDKNEGWGAVANEAMSNGCVLVGSSAIGSVPFLVEDGVNGCIFQSEDVDSLTSKVEWLLQHRKEMKQMAVEGYNTMKAQWTPKQAAERFLSLVDCLSKGEDTPFLSGPCSNAEPLSNNWYKKLSEDD